MRQIPPPVCAAILGLLLASPASSAAQGPVRDRAAFVVTRGNDVIGREEYTLRQGRQSGGGRGFTLTVNAHYPPDRTSPIVISTIEFGADSQPATARIDLDTGERPSIFVAMSARRVTVRTVTPRGESAKQFPAAERTILLDEFMLSPLVMLPGTEEGNIRILAPRTDQMNLARLRDRGTEPVEVRGLERQLRHITLESDTEIRHLWYDDSWQLVKVELPQSGTTAVRLPRG